MSCTDCGSKIQGRCDCCYLVDGDETFRQVYWCEDCKAYICAECENKRIRRMRAAIKDKTNKFLTYLKLKFK